MSEQSDWVTMREAAAMLNVNPKTIRRWADRGVLIARRFGPRLVRIERASLEDAGERLGWNHA
jgi:excisionase family DNA binding protein